MYRILLSLIVLIMIIPLSSFSYHGAKYEPPDGKVYHGVGWQNTAQTEYMEMFSDSTQPLLFQMMIPLPGDVRRRGGMTVERLIGQFNPDHFDVENRYCELSVHFTDNTNMLDTVFALSDRLDGYIDTMAIALREHGKPIFLRIGLEMNGAWNGYTPYVFPVAFRKLVEGLRERDVDNFASVWCYEPDAPADFADSTRGDWKWYPGDDVVDWFGLDPFDADHFDPSEPDSLRGGLTKKGRTELFLRFAEARGKPVYLNELSARHVFITPDEQDEDSSDGRDDWEYWFAPFFEFLDNHPNIKAFNYINLEWTLYQQWEHWGDARLQINSYIRNRWVAEISGDRYLHVGYNIDSTLSVMKDKPLLPFESNLTAYPNPFNGQTEILFNIFSSGSINLSIFDLHGRKIVTLYDDFAHDGSHQVIWDAVEIPTGVYLCRMQTGKYNLIRKLVLIR